MMKILVLVFSIAIVATLCIIYDPVKIITLIAQADPLLVVAGLFLSGLLTVLWTLKWSSLVEGVAFRDMYAVQMIGTTISNLSPGKIAEPIKAILLKTSSGKMVSSTLPSIIWERILDMVTLLLLSAISMPVLASNTNLVTLSIAAFLIFAAILAVACALLFKRSFGFYLFNIFGRFWPIKKLSSGFLKNFYDTKIESGRILKSFGLAVATWILAGVIAYTVLLSLGVSLPLALVISITTLSTLIGILSFLPGGLGSTEVVMSLLLTASGVDSVAAITGVLMYRFFTLWLVALLGGFSLIHMRKPKTDGTSVPARKYNNIEACST